jgi:hypothetical protein
MRAKRLLQSASENGKYITALLKEAEWEPRPWGMYIFAGCRGLILNHNQNVNDRLV